MLNNIYFKIPLWTWLIIIVVILYSVYHILYKKSCKQKDNIILTNETKEEFVNSNFSNIVIYNFNTSWCGWSKKFQPEWDDFSKHINKINNIKALDIKCDDDVKNIELATKYNVPGYPYIIIVVDDKEPIIYDGDRTSVALIERIQTIIKK
jgi:thiol-disulfide isomerase/thioredoxin